MSKNNGSIPAPQDRMEDMGLFRAIGHCLTVAVRAVTRIFTALDNVSYVGEHYSDHFKVVTIAELNARRDRELAALNANKS